MRALLRASEGDNLMERKPCNAIGCKNLASRYPKILILAKCDVHHQASPLELCLPMPLCREHQSTYDPQGSLIEETRVRIRDAMASLRKAEPDFDSMDVEWGRIGDKFWQMATSGAGKPN